MNVYCLYFTNGKRYVGVGNIRRVQGHFWNAKSPLKRQVVTDAIRKYGDSVKWRWLFTNCSTEQAFRLEIFLIRHLNLQDRRFGYNRSSGGEAPALGVKMPPMTEESKAKRVATRKARDNYPKFINRKKPHAANSGSFKKGDRPKYKHPKGFPVAPEWSCNTFAERGIFPPWKGVKSHRKGKKMELISGRRVFFSEMEYPVATSG